MTNSEIDNKSAMSNFPDRFKEIRIEQGLTQEEFADKLGIGPRTCQRYEKVNKLPGGGFLIEIAILGYNLHWLFIGDGDKYTAKSFPSIT